MGNRINKTNWNKVFNELQKSEKFVSKAQENKQSAAASKALEGAKAKPTEETTFKATLSLTEKLKSLSAKIQKFINQKILKTPETPQNLERIGKGKVKLVWAPKNGPAAEANLPIDRSKTKEQAEVYYTPVKTFFGSREKSLKAEYKILKDIKDNLHGKDIKNLALNAEEVEIGGRFALKVDKGSDFEDEIKKNTPTLEQRVKFGKEYISGMKELHDAGFAYGDIKPENCLLMKGEVKISDFGKSRNVGEGKKPYTGNMRFAPPEGSLSKKGDVYGAALVLIRIFEESVITQNESLLPAEDKEEFEPLEERRGIERYILEHKAFQAIEPRGWKGKVELMKRRAKAVILSKNEKEKQTEALNQYIIELGERLEGKLQERRANDLVNLLLDMTNGNPEERPSMEEVQKSYNSIFFNVSENQSASTPPSSSESSRGAP